MGVGVILPDTVLMHMRMRVLGSVMAVAVPVLDVVMVVFGVGMDVRQLVVAVLVSMRLTMGVLFGHVLLPFIVRCFSVSSGRTSASLR